VENTNLRHKDGSYHAASLRLGRRLVIRRENTVPDRHRDRHHAVARHDEQALRVTGARGSLSCAGGRKISSDACMVCAWTSMRIRQLSRRSARHRSVAKGSVGKLAAWTTFHPDIMRYRSAWENRHRNPDQPAGEFSKRRLRRGTMTAALAMV